MVAGVGGSGGFDQEKVDFVDGYGAVLYSTRDDVDLPGGQVYVAEVAFGVAEVDAEIPLEDVEEVVGLGMRVPDKLAFNLDHEDVVSVVVGDDLWRPVLGEPGELGLEVDGGVRRRLICCGHTLSLWKKR
jgi:hypothetical protein